MNKSIYNMKTILTPVILLFLVSCASPLSSFKPGDKYPNYVDELFSDKSLNVIKDACIEVIKENGGTITSTSENTVQGKTPMSFFYNHWGVVMYMEIHKTSTKKTMFYTEKVEGYNVKVITYGTINMNGSKLAKGMLPRIISQLTSKLG